MHNPYTPPSAQVGDIEVRKGSGIKAILAGLAVDIGGSILSGVAFVMIAGIFMSNTGADGDQIASSINALADDPWIYSGGVAAGFLFSVLGGYTCARIARHSEYRLGAILAAISIAFGLIVGTGEDSLALDIALMAAAFASTMIGIWLGTSRNAKDRTRRQRLAQPEQNA